MRINYIYVLLFFLLIVLISPVASAATCKVSHWGDLDNPTLIGDISIYGSGGCSSVKREHHELGRPMVRHRCGTNYFCFTTYPTYEEVPYSLRESTDHLTVVYGFPRSDTQCQNIFGGTRYMSDVRASNFYETKTNGCHIKPGSGVTICDSIGCTSDWEADSTGYPMTYGSPLEMQESEFQYLSYLEQTDDVSTCALSNVTYGGTSYCYDPNGTADYNVIEGCAVSGTCSSGDDTSDTGSGDSGTGDSGTGDSGTGDSGTGDSGTGDSGTGDSGTGDSGTGDSGTGDSGTGDSGSGTDGGGGSAGGSGSDTTDPDKGDSTADGSTTDGDGGTGTGDTGDTGTGSGTDGDGTGSGTDGDGTGGGGTSDTGDGDGTGGCEGTLDECYGYDGFGQYAYGGEVKEFDPDGTGQQLIDQAKLLYQQKLEEIKQEINSNFTSVSSGGSCQSHTLTGFSVSLDVCSKLEQWSPVVRSAVLLCCSLVAFGILFRVNG